MDMRFVSFAFMTYCRLRVYVQNVHAMEYGRFYRYRYKNVLCCVPGSVRPRVLRRYGILVANPNNIRAQQATSTTGMAAYLVQKQVTVTPATVGTCWLPARGDK